MSASKLRLFDYRIIVNYGNYYVVVTVLRWVL